MGASLSAIEPESAATRAKWRQVGTCSVLGPTYIFDILSFVFAIASENKGSLEIKSRINLAIKQ